MLRGFILLSLFCLLFLLTFIFYTPYGYLAENFIFIGVDTPNATHPYYLPFDYTILEEKICEPSLDFLIVVHTAVFNFDKRKAYRETFSNEKWEKRYNFRTVYAVARAKDNATESRVHEESEKYHDIIQADFVDAYTNMTIKNMMWLRYVRDYCPKVKYILKIDDDVVFNLFDFVEQLRGVNLTIPRSISCHRYYDVPQQRDSRRKWYVSRAAHPGNYWAPYCSGPAYFLTADLVGDLIRQTETHKYYVSVDDAFMTGTIASEIGVVKNNMWQHKLTIDKPSTEYSILTSKVWFGYYKDVVSLKRIWKSLVEMYGESPKKRQ